MKQNSVIIFALAFSLCFTSCSDSDEAYPNLLTEIMDGITNNSGTLTTLFTDNGIRYTVTNPQSGLVANAMYRCLCDYTLDNNNATIYSLSGVYLLRDSTVIATADPLTIVSAWQTKRYINIHLSTKTQGGTQYFGYITDSIIGQHVYLSLHHRQNGDPEAYSTNVYASIPLDSIKGNVITLQNSYEFQR